jgi:chitinase
VFTVSLSSPSDAQVKVNFATANGSASKNDNDYSGTSGKLTFRPGETRKTVTVLVKGDKRNEADETFFVHLDNAKGASIEDGKGQGTIVNDDARRGSFWYAYAWAEISEAIDDFLPGRRTGRGR